MENFVITQLRSSSAALREHLGVSVSMIAWPFGIYDDELLRMARECGYVAGVTLDGRLVRGTDPALALPRFLVSDRAPGRALAAVLPRGRS